MTSPSGVEISTPLGGDGDDLAVLDHLHPAGLGQERRDRRADEVLAVADADDERALLARRDEQVAVVQVHRDEGVVTPQLAEGCADGGDQIAVVVALDQVRDDLGVGLRGEGVALVGELPAQLRVVLDDPVQDDVDLVGAVAVRVRVLLGHPAVGGPAGVADAGRRRGRGHGDAAVRERMLLDSRAKVRQVADSPDAVDLTVRDHRDPCRVIAAVLELLEPRDQQVPARSVTYVSDYAAHKRRGRVPRARRAVVL